LGKFNIDQIGFNPEALTVGLYFHRILKPAFVESVDLPNLTKMNRVTGKLNISLIQSDPVATCVTGRNYPKGYENLVVIAKIKGKNITSSCTTF
jgi:hypothetical protein